MAATQKVAMASIHHTPVAFKSGSNPIQHQVSATDKDGNASGSKILLSSSNRGVAIPSSPELIGHAPLGIIPIAPGSAVITATPADNPAAATSMTVTVA